MRGQNRRVATVSVPLWVINKGTKGKPKRVKRSRSLGAKVRKAAAKKRPLNEINGHIYRPRTAKQGARRKYGPLYQGFPLEALARAPFLMSPSEIEAVRRRRRASLGLKNPTHSVGEKKMASKRRKKKLPRDSKGHFLPRKGRGRRKAKAKSSPARRQRHRRAKAVKNPARRRRSRAVRNPSHRRMRARRNPQTAAERAVFGAESKPSKRRKSGKRRRRSTVEVSKLSSIIGRIVGGKRRQKKAGHKLHRGGPTGARLAVLRQRRRAARGHMSASQKRYMQAHGLVHVNPLDLKKIVAGMKDLVLEGAVGVGSAVSVFWAGQWLGTKIVEKMGAKWAPYAAPGASLALTVVEYVALRMTGKVKFSKLAGPAFVGGVIGTGFSVLAHVMVDDKPGAPQISLGRKLGLPVGEVLLPGLDVGMNLKDYVPRAELNAYVERGQLQAYVPRGELQGVEAVMDRKSQVEKLLGEYVAAQGDSVGV